MLSVPLSPRAELRAAARRATSTSPSSTRPQLCVVVRSARRASRRSSSASPRARASSAARLPDHAAGALAHARSDPRELRRVPRAASGSRAPTIPFVSNRTRHLDHAPRRRRDPKYWVAPPAPDGALRRRRRHAPARARTACCSRSAPGRRCARWRASSRVRASARSSPSLPPPRGRRSDDRRHFVASFGRLWAAGVRARVREAAAARAGGSACRCRPTRSSTSATGSSRARAPPRTSDAREPSSASRASSDWVRRADLAPLRRLPAASASSRRPGSLFMDDGGLGRAPASSGCAPRARRRDRGPRRRRLPQASATTSTRSRPSAGRGGYDALDRATSSSDGRMRRPDRAPLAGHRGRDASAPARASSTATRSAASTACSSWRRRSATRASPRPLHIDGRLERHAAAWRGEPLRYPEKATVLGPVQVIPREFPGVTLREHRRRRCRAAAPQRWRRSRGTALARRASRTHCANELTSATPEAERRRVPRSSPLRGSASSRPPASGAAGERAGCARAAST